MSIRPTALTSGFVFRTSGNFRMFYLACTATTVSSIPNPYKSKSVTFNSHLFKGGDPVSLQLPWSHPNM